MSILSTLQYGILSLTLDRADRRNAITSAMFDRLAEELERAAGNPKVRLVLLKSTGNVFSAGADLSEMLASPETLRRTEERFFAALSSFSKPVIAQVQGPCVGEAFAALLYCDLVYAGSQALFSMPSVALGRAPRWGAAQIMTAAAGSAAGEKLLLSEPISADEALAMRLITRVVEDEHLEQNVAAKTARLAVLPPGAAASTKTLITAVRREQLKAFAGLEEEVCARQDASPEAAEALKAFLEGRKPVFAPQED